jgi:hypothetical protein
MKNLFIILNIIFLLTGNLLFSSSHHLHDHSYAHDHNNIIEECEDCIIIDNNNNFILDSQVFVFSIDALNPYIFKYLNISGFLNYKKYNSRAPPIS